MTKTLLYSEFKGRDGHGNDRNYRHTAEDCTKFVYVELRQWTDGNDTDTIIEVGVKREGETDHVDTFVAGTNNREQAIRQTIELFDGWVQEVLDQEPPQIDTPILIEQMKMSNLNLLRKAMYDADSKESHDDDADKADRMATSRGG